MSRKVISSPFQYSNDSPISNDNTLTNSNPIISTQNDINNNNLNSSNNAKYAPPPSIQEIKKTNDTINKEEIKTNNILSNQNPLDQYTQGKGGKLSPFAELSNKKPPTLYNIDNKQSNISSQQMNYPKIEETIKPIDPKSYTSINTPCNIIPLQNQDNREVYQTKLNPIPPPAVRNYHTIDQGNCSPHFMRSSCYCIPSNPLNAKELNIRLGLVIQPLADIKYGDNELPIVRPHTNNNIIRCSRCGSFHCSLDKYINQGHSYICFLCNFSNDISDENYSALSMDGIRLDIQQHPELYYGSFEYIAPPDYIIKHPYPLSFVFVIETSYIALKSGIIQALCDSLLSILKSLPKNSIARFGFVTFTNIVQFYNLSLSNSQLQILTVPDIDNMVLPLHRDNLLAKYHDSSDLFNKFFEILPKLCNQNEDTSIKLCTATAVRTAGMILKDISGKIILFQSSMPSLGQGSISNRYKSDMVGTSREKDLYYPAESYYKDMALDCCNHGISFDLFLFAHGKFIDVASVAPLCKLTGGELIYYLQFNYPLDRIKLHNQLFNLITKTNGTNAICRIRTSTGIDINNYFGNFQLKHGSDMHSSIISNNSTSCVYFNITDTLTDESFVGFQCVLLYTTSFGETRIRIHSLQIPTSKHLGKSFAAIDLDSLLYLNSIAYWQQCKTKERKIVRETVIQDCLRSLLSFRKNCATHDRGLAVPDSLRLYPLYQLCLLKSPLLVDGKKNVDNRVTEWIKIFHTPLSEFSIYLYPRMFSLHNLPTNVGTITQSGNFIWPKWEILSKENLSSSGCYLLDNTVSILIWIGRSVPIDFLQEVFGIDSLLSSQVKTISLSPPENGQRINQIHSIINEIRSKRSYYANLIIIPQGSLNEMAFIQLMKEDRVEESMSYSDILSYLNMTIAKQTQK